MPEKITVSDDVVSLTNSVLSDRATVAAIRDATGVTRQAISLWKSKGYIPADRVKAVARIVRRPAKHLRPDLFR